MGHSGASFKMLKIQRIRWCVQCECPLPLKCARCVKHPNRKPKIQDVYDWPPILATRDCGCIQIACQREGCTAKMWRHVPSASKRDGKCRYRNQFCSPRCSSIAGNAGRLNRKEVSCAECSKKLIRKAYNLKTWKHSFCGPKCRMIFYRKEMYESKERARRAEENPVTQMLYCKPHAQPTTHRKIGGGLLECAEAFERSGKPCQARRMLPTKTNDGVMAIGAHR
jgi:hypothetical protein